MVNHPGDGALYAWEEIADEGWETLLVGNGLSINVSAKFAYDSLYEEAEKDPARGGLSDQDRAIFERFDTNNFEVVLGKLSDAIAMAGVLEEEAVSYGQRFRSVQTALGSAVRSVHLRRSEIPDSSLKAIQEELERYGAIFSTSYDLIVYWTMGYEDGYAKFCDCFWGRDSSFDPANYRIRPGRRPIYYVHGALHLIVDSSGTTRKLVADDRTLLDQFGEPIPGDPGARPLLISEGAAGDKLGAVEGNDYLAHVYETLKSRSGPLLVFGNSLRGQDRHLIDAINANPDRPVAISMVKDDEQDLRERQSPIWGPLKTKLVYFFDAATHPLGASELRAKPRVRFRRRPLKAPAAAPSESA